MSLIQIENKNLIRLIRFLTWMVTSQNINYNEIESHKNKTFITFYE